LLAAQPQLAAVEWMAPLLATQPLLAAVEWMAPLLAAQPQLAAVEWMAPLLAAQPPPMTLAEFLELVPRAWLAGFAAVLGLIIGSFLNAVIYRLPRDVAVSKPRSFCPRCKSLIPWYRNIPLASWVMLGGRCADCREPISVRYPLVELGTGVLFAAAVYRWGISWSALSSIIFGCAMLVLALVDYDFKILPNAITLPGIAVGVLLSLVDPRLDWLDSLIGALVAGGLLYGVAWLYLKLRAQPGMGMGDVKMIAMIGAFLGWKGALLTILIGSFIGSIVGLSLMKLKGREWDYALPFGTFLALAAVIVDWSGAELLAWYWRTMGLGG
jgi:leader peptidase (prepilin peptidase)/N-methyltransferase